MANVLWIIHIRARSRRRRPSPVVKCANCVCVQCALAICSIRNNLKYLGLSALLMMRARCPRGECGRVDCIYYIYICTSILYIHMLMESKTNICARASKRHNLMDFLIYDHKTSCKYNIECEQPPCVRACAYAHSGINIHIIRIICGIGTIDTNRERAHLK